MLLFQKDAMPFRQQSEIGIKDNDADNLLPVCITRRLSDPNKTHSNSMGSTPVPEKRAVSVKRYAHQSYISSLCLPHLYPEPPLFRPWSPRVPCNVHYGTPRPLLGGRQLEVPQGPAHHRARHIDGAPRVTQGPATCPEIHIRLGF